MNGRYVLLLVVALLCCALPAMAREVFYYNDLNTDPGWTTEGQWAFGSQDECCDGDPHSGAGMYMHGPEAYYLPDMGAEALTTTAIDCTGKHGVFLNFWHAQRICGGDQGSVQVSNDGEEWVTVWVLPCGGTDWSRSEFDISEIADDQPTVYVRWVFGPTDSSNESWGMRIDDVFLTADSPNPALEVLLYDQWSDNPAVNGNIAGILYQKLGNVMVETRAGVECDAGMDCILGGKQVVVIPVSGIGREPSAPAPGAVSALIGENRCLMECGDSVGDALRDFVLAGGTAVVTGETYGLSGFVAAAGLMDAEWAATHTTDTIFTALLPDHPLLADVTEPITSQVITNAYLVGEGIETVLADPYDRTVVSCRQLGRGAVVLIGYSYDEYDDNSAQILANAVQYPRSAAKILLYDEDTINHVGKEALNRLYLPFVTATSEDFDTLLASQDWDLVVVDAPGEQPESWAGLGEYVAAGGRVVISTPAFGTDPALDPIFGVSTLTALELLPEVYPTGPGLALFEGVPNLVNWGDNWPTPGGYAFALDDPGAELFAEYDISPTAPARAALALGNDGRTFANGFTWDDRDQNSDEDEVQDVVELVMNEIRYLLTASGTNFSALPQMGTPPLEVSFTDLSMNSPEAWTWDFGDGSSSTEQNPTHTYENPGLYTVTLWTYGPYGADTKTKTDYILVTWDPVADFEAEPTSGSVPLTVNFTDLSNAPTSWEWNFGDGGTSTDQNPTHQYTAPGVYTVTLTVANALGEDTEVKAEYITVTSMAPVASFIAEPTSGPAPLTVAFADISTNGPTSWSWSFGDGESAATQHPVHTYDNPGCYTVSLSVANDGGSDTLTKPDYIVVAFPDIEESHWAFEAIMACQAAGIVQGYWDNTFRPELPVDRAQMAAFISRALAGGDENVPAGPATATFADVPTSHWAFKYVEYAYANEIVFGYWDGYHPTEIVDRGQMAVFLARAMVGGESNVPAAGATPTFADVTADGAWSWCYNHVEYIAGQEVTTGYPDGNYHPEFEVSRDQMAVFVQRAFDLPIPGS